jgi:hypothetical protein
MKNKNDIHTRGVLEAPLRKKRKVTDWPCRLNKLSQIFFHQNEKNKRTEYTLNKQQFK